MSILKELGGFFSKLSFEDLPGEALDSAKGRILDTIACAYAGKDSEASRVAKKLAKGGDVTVFFSNLRASLLDGVLINGVMAHSTSQDDLMAGIAHPGSVVVPAAIGVGETLDLNGKDLLLSIVIGYEAIWRILRATGRLSNPSFRPGTIFTTFGSCASASKLFGLDPEAFSHALGYAASLTPGTPNEGWWGEGMETFFEIGVSSQIGVLSAILAKNGAKSSYYVIEGRDGFLKCWGAKPSPEEATKDLGREFAITRTFIKPFAACGANQIPIQVALKLSKEKIKPQDVEKVVERVRKGITNYAGINNPGPFSTYAQALMSIQFCTSAAILGRPLDTPDYLINKFKDEEVFELSKKVELVEEEGRRNPKFEIYLKDGRVIAYEEDPDRSIHVPTLDRMKEKVKRFAPDRADDIIEAVMNLENINVRELTKRLK